VRIELMRRAWALAIAGTPQTRIATELGISQSQVSRYLARVSAKAWDRLEDDAKTYALLSLAQTDLVLARAIEAFDRSTRPKKSATKKTTPLKLHGGTTTEGLSADATTTQVVDREGEPAWLGEIRASIRLRLEILDRFAPRPASNDPQGPSGLTVVDALAAAEARDAEYQPDPDSEPDGDDPADDAAAQCPPPSTDAG
jgi:predicted transcriptional regulator